MPKNAKTESIQAQKKGLPKSKRIVKRQIKKAELKNLVLAKIKGKNLGKNTMKKDHFNQSVNKKELGKMLDQNSFQCSICLQLLLLPVSIKCGHSFCQQCIQSAIVSSLSCPLCRQKQDFSDFTVSLKTNRLIDFYLLDRKEEKEKYQLRKVACQRWIEKRNSFKIKIKQPVDFRLSTVNKWKIACISAIRKSEEATILTLTYANPLYNEKYASKKKNYSINKFLEIELPSTSPLIASKQFFTKDKYLQNYTFPSPPQKNQIRIPQLTNLFEYQYRRWAQLEAQSSSQSSSSSLQSQNSQDSQGLSSVQSQQSQQVPNQVYEIIQSDSQEVIIQEQSIFEPFNDMYSEQLHFPSEFHDPMKDEASFPFFF